MTKTELSNKTQAVESETQEALQALFNEVNKGQQKQLVKKEKIKKLFDRYNVEYKREGK